MKDHAAIVISRSTFCGLLILNGVLVGTSCLVAVRPVYVERAKDLGTIEGFQELSYLYGLIGLGALISTAIALIAVMFFSIPRRQEQVEQRGSE